MTVHHVSQKANYALATRKMPLRQALALFLLMSVCGFAFSEAGNSTQSNTPAAHQNGVMEYVIGPADVLSISVWNHQELNRTVTVRPDGKVSLALVGEVQAVGLTPLQLQETLEKALGDYVDIIPGEVAVVVDAVHSYTVSVLGEVRRPGRFEFKSQSTVLDALAMAGGLTEFASGKNITVIRTNKGQTENLRFNYKKLAKGPGSDARVLIVPGDIIVVR